MNRLELKNLANDTTELYLSGVIGDDWDGITAKQFDEAVRPVTTSKLNLRINSPGGSVFEVQAMVASLARWKGGKKGRQVIADVEGIAASAASFLAVKADVTRIADGSWLMVHMSQLLYYGNADELARMLDRMRKADEHLIDAYAAQAGDKSTREQIEQYLRAETYFTAQEALDAGLVDEVTETAGTIAACLDPRLTAKAPDALRNARSPVRGTPADLAAHAATLARVAARRANRLAIARQSP